MFDFISHKRLISSYSQTQEGKDRYFSVKSLLIDSLDRATFQSLKAQRPQPILV